MFRFFSSSADGWQYLKNHDVTLLAGETRFRFSPGHDGKVVDGGFREYILVHLTEKQFETVAQADTVEGTLGGDDFKLSGPQRSMLRDFARYLKNPDLVAKSDEPKGPAPAPAPAPVPEPAPVVKPSPDSIPAGRAVLFSADEKAPCFVMKSLRMFDELDVILNSPNGTADYLALFEARVAAGQWYKVPSGTMVRTIETRDRPRSKLLPKVWKIEVLEGGHKGLVGWCSSGLLILSSNRREPSEDDKKPLDEMQGAEDLRMGQLLEKQGKIPGALRYYEGVIKKYGASHSAKVARERVAALKKPKSK